MPDLDYNDKATASGEPILVTTTDTKSDPDLCYNYSGQEFFVDAKIQGISDKSDKIYVSNSALSADMLIIFKINGLPADVGEYNVYGT